ncbi:DDT domain-containing protein DDR4-like [Mangifera indica]|uniref:DDT domain-containing protein DDR4-like n=1 Tax=Mangifera indica TaxID=29780 RepID=UPI001CFAA0EE|nr:DDT domain-containing protein DDR4-like [Mangifera indica]
MAGGRRKPTPSPKKTRGQNMPEVKADAVVVSDESSSESEVKKLRERWELACVLNFLNVFELVIASGLKLTAEEIEMGLIEPNSSNAQLHIVLLKGIPPVSKLLNGSDAWVSVLHKKLAMWWPWVAEGEIPLTAAKGEEISRYKALEPTCRLLILKALCEIRADQDDVLSYINNALKEGTQVSSFRKDKIGKDVNGTSYWYDGSTTIGYRLYKEVNKIGSKTKCKGKACLTLPATCTQWETLATNFEEFCEVVDELSSSKVVAEVAIGKRIAVDVIPVVEKFHKKKERSLKRKQRQEMLLLNGFRNSFAVGMTRSCRSRRPISYTFDDYDRAIDEAIELTKKSTTNKEQRHGKSALNDSTVETKMEDSYDNGDSAGIDTESDRLQEAGDGDDVYDNKKDSDNGNGSDSSNSDDQRNLGKTIYGATSVQKPVGSCWSERLARDSNHPAMETRNLSTKSRLRQRPTRNSALDSIALDSDDDESSEETNSKLSEHENLSMVADSEEVSDS